MILTWAYAYLDIIRLYKKDGGIFLGGRAAALPPPTPPTGDGTFEAIAGALGRSFSSLAVHEMGLPRRLKKGVPGTMGRRAWKRPYEGLEGLIRPLK